MSSMQANKKRRLPKVLSILFGSSLVSLAMAMSGGPANAYYQVCAGPEAGFDACFRCYYTNTGFGYCYDSYGNVGNQCCTSGEGAEGHGWCQAWSGHCC
jgi:hypothetical protein